MKWRRDGGMVIDVDRRTMEQIDKEEGRVRLPAQCITALIGLGGAIVLWKQNADIMAPTLKKMGLWDKTRCAEGLMRWILDRICRNMCVRQNLAIQENTRDMIISVGVKPAPRCINVPQDVADELVGAVMRDTCNMCLKDEREAGKCPLRKALDAVPGVVSDESGWWACPYMQGEKQKWEV